MRCYLGENYIPFSIPTENRSTSVKVTSDITEVARTVQILLYITHGDDVIGKTNRVELKVFATKAGTPLAPREEFDEVIRQQQATIAEQEETISDQTEIIQANERTISGLNTQVSTLTAQNDSLANQNETSRETIQYMIDNPPTPQLETPPVVIPSGVVQQILPSEGYAGLRSVTVDRITAAVDSHIVPDNIKSGVTILGVTGDLVPLELDSDSNTAYFGADEGGLYLSTNTDDENSFALGLNGNRIYVNSLGG